jgi:hypothetical protein
MNARNNNINVCLMFMKNGYRAVRECWGSCHAYCLPPITTEPNPNQCDERPITSLPSPSHPLLKLETSLFSSGAQKASLQLQGLECTFPSHPADQRPKRTIMETRALQDIANFASSVSGVQKRSSAQFPMELPVKPIMI